MQNFVAVMLFATLVAAVFWPDDMLKPRPNQTNLYKQYQNTESDKANKHSRDAILSGSGMIYHYMGFTDRSGSDE